MWLVDILSLDCQNKAIGLETVFDLIDLIIMIYYYITIYITMA